jgi:hypothetical protein
MYHPIYPMDSNPTLFVFSAPKGDLLEPHHNRIPSKHVAMSFALLL